METVVDDQGRPEPPPAADELTMLLGFLDFQRATLAWKTDRLDAEGLRATVGASTMTLGGLLKHLALVEDSWFSERLHGRDPVPPWDTVDWHADRDWEWHSAAHDSPAQLRALWQAAVDRSGRRSPRRWPTAAWTGSPRGRGPTAAPRACAGSSSI